jgi:hypothetical protein
MDKEQRLAAVDADIKRLLDRAATDNSRGGVVGFGSALLAAKLLSLREQVPTTKPKEKP